MNRTATWTRIGTDVSGTTTIDQLLNEAGLNYTVHKEPMFLANGTEIKGKVSTVKDDGTPIGVVSEKYSIYQNQDAFGFIGDIPDIKFVRAGETHNGMVYVIGQLPNLTVMDDNFTPYVIFQNSHNGLFQVKATICPLRIVCQNQFAYSFKQVRNTISIQHSKQLPTKVAQAQRLITDAAAYMNGFTNTAEELAQLRVTETDRYAIMDAFFESTRELTERQQAMLEEQRAFFNRCYEADDNGNFRGTAWGMVNAFTDFTTHKEVKATTHSDDSKFMRVTFDTDAMNKFMDLIRARVG